LRSGLFKSSRVRICVIFNPAARGEKARRFRRHLSEIGAQSSLKLTTAPGDARRLAAEAVRENFEIVVAAGGDGTVNEVLNGIGDQPQGFERARLAVLPLGTVNVFARELGLPRNLGSAWPVIMAGRETRIDLPRVEYAGQGGREHRYFAQLAGAGLDARAVELVHWELKKKIGPLAYVWAGLQALRGEPAKIEVAMQRVAPSQPALRSVRTQEIHEAAGRAAAVASPKGDANLQVIPTTGALVLVGNGRLYGGDFRVFSSADLRDGLLNVCLFPRANWFTVARCGPSLLLRGCLPAAVAERFSTPLLSLSSVKPVPLELDGELIGHLPAQFSIESERLRVIVP
jgi:diacylglycerol kinase family enzyme